MFKAREPDLGRFNGAFPVACHAYDDRALAHPERSAVAVRKVVEEAYAPGDAHGSLPSNQESRRSISVRQTMTWIKTPGVRL
jgi:hypothetical protein